MFSSSLLVEIILQASNLIQFEFRVRNNFNMKELCHIMLQSSNSIGTHFLVILMQLISHIKMNLKYTQPYS